MVFSSDLMDPTQESTYRFLDGFVGEMAKLFPDEYFHIGGDEVNPKQWNQNARGPGLHAKAWDRERARVCKFISISGS